MTLIQASPRNTSERGPQRRRRWLRATIGLTLVVVLIAFLTIPSLKRTWSPLAQVSPETKEYFDRISTGFVIHGVGPGVRLSPKLTSEKQKQQSAAAYLRHRCRTLQPSLPLERAKFCYDAYILGLLDPAGRRRSAKWLNRELKQLIQDADAWEPKRPFEESARNYYQHLHALYAVLSIVQGPDEEATLAALDSLSLELQKLTYFKNAEFLDAIRRGWTDFFDTTNESDPSLVERLRERFPHLEVDGNRFHTEIANQSSIEIMLMWHSSSEVIVQLDQHRKAWEVLSLEDLFENLNDEELLERLRSRQSSRDVYERVQTHELFSTNIDEKDRVLSLTLASRGGGGVISGALGANGVRSGALKDYFWDRATVVPPQFPTSKEVALAFLQDEIEANSPVRHVLIELIGHGTKEGMMMTPSDSSFDAADILKIADKFPRKSFVFVASACYFGDQAVALEKLLEERDDSELSDRLILITHSSPGEVTFSTRFGGLFSLYAANSLNEEGADQFVRSWYRSARLLDRIKALNRPVIVTKGKAWRL